MKRTMVVLPLLLGAMSSACTFEAGEGFASIEPASLDARFDPGGRLGDDGRFLVMGGYGVLPFAITLGVREVVLDEVVTTGSGRDAVFDPANPPPGYTLCHADHCHHVDGRLVSYEDVQAELSGGGTTTYLPLVTMPVRRALDLATGELLALEQFNPSSELPAATIGRTRVEIGTFHLDGTVTDGAFGVRDVPLYIDIVVSGVISSIAATRVITTDEHATITLRTEVALPGTFLDGIDFASLEADGRVEILEGAAAEQVAAAILSIPLGVEIQ